MFTELSPISARSSPDANRAGSVAPHAGSLAPTIRRRCGWRLDRLQRRLPDGGRFGVEGAKTCSRSMPPPKRWA